MKFLIMNVIIIVYVLTATIFIINRVSELGVG